MKDSNSGEEEVEQTEEKEIKKNNNNHKKRNGLVVLAVVLLIGAVALFFYLKYKSAHITTDDAFVDGNIHTIASKVPGTVKQVYVKSNQFVKKGEVLVELDLADYEVRVREASAAVNSEKGKIGEIAAKSESSKRQMAELQAKVDTMQATLDLQKANLEQAEADVKRAEVLYKKETISKERYEKTTTAYKIALAQVRAAEEGLKNAVLGVETQKAVINQADSARVTQTSEIKRRAAQLSDAELKYGYTKIFAPVDGYITKKSVEVGNQIQSGQPLMAVVPLDVGDIHITANYKETQLEKVRPGQKVEFKVDTYPGKKFTGKVESIMSGTGAMFSLFPPENATGNYVKVVQRIPVKILLDKDTDKEHILRIGMSVVPTIIVE